LLLFGFSRAKGARSNRTIGRVFRQGLFWVGSGLSLQINELSFKRTIHEWGAPIMARSCHPCVSQIPTTPPNSLVILAWVKITQPNQPHTNTQESFVHKVCLWWGEPFEKTAMSSLARELKILVSVVRFRPGPPRISIAHLLGYFPLWLGKILKDKIEFHN
jgi:hypothetical protein